MPVDFARSLSLAENRNYSQSIVRSAESRKASYVSGQLVALNLIISVVWFIGLFYQLVLDKILEVRKEVTTK